MGPIPRVQFNPPDDLNTATTATAAVPKKRPRQGRTTRSVAERTRVRPAEAEADEAPPAPRTRKTV